MCFDLVDRPASDCGDAAIRDGRVGRAFDSNRCTAIFCGNLINEVAGELFETIGNDGVAIDGDD